MKLLAYALFVITVLLVSGFARAEVMMPFIQAATYQTPVHVEQVSFQPEDKRLTVTGRLPNPCMQMPAASLTQDQKNPNTLTLRLTSPLPMETCVSKVQPYLTTLDLPTLAYASQLRLEAEAVYVIRTEGYDFEMKVQGSDLIR